MTDKGVEESVSIKRPRAAVFAAWASPEALATWFAPMAVRPPAIRMHFAVGGPFRVEMDLGAQGVHITEGRFLEIVPNERIRLTWRCDAWDDPPSEVEVTFTDRGEHTVVRVRHSHITSLPAQEGQRYGWAACLGELRAQLHERP